MVQNGDGKALFGKLLFVFVCYVADEQLEPLALIQPMYIPTGCRERKDTHLGLYRLTAQPRNESVLVSTRVIIRGALLAKANDKPNDFFAVDMVDSDMFIRLKEVFSE